MRRVRSVRHMQGKGPQQLGADFARRGEPFWQRVWLGGVQGRGEVGGEKGKWGDNIAIRVVSTMTRRNEESTSAVRR